jgi:hypothetical protein
MAIILFYLLGFAVVGARVRHRGVAGSLVASLVVAMTATLWWSA